MMDWLRELSQKARYTLAIGSCAAFGGLPTISPNVNDILGLQFLMRSPGGYLGEKFRSGAGFPVVNIPGCPAIPEATTTERGLSGSTRRASRYTA